MNAARLLLDRDGYTLEQVLWIINRVNRDDFWSVNIRSTSKLRKQFDELKGRALRGSHKSASSTRTEQAIDVARELYDLENQPTTPEITS